MKKYPLFVVLLALLALVPAAGAQDSAPVDLTLFMTFIPNVQFAPVYVGIEKGYFADGGLNLKIEHGFDEALGVERIASNDLQFGLISGEQVILARAKGRPVVYVYAWFQEYPVGIVAPVESGITSVADLAGRKVGIPVLSGASYTGLTVLLAANNMTLNDIRVEVIGFTAPEVVCVGGVDASVIYVNNEPLQIAMRAMQDDCGSVTDVVVFPVSDVAKLVSNGIVTNEETAANHPDLVKAVIAGFDTGLRDAINNPAEAYLLSARYVEGLPMTDALKAALEKEAAAQAEFLAASPDREAIAESRRALIERLSSQFAPETLSQMTVLLATIDLWDADRPGYSDPISWETMQETLLAMKDPATNAPILDSAIDLSKAYSNDFLPAE